MSKTVRYILYVIIMIICVMAVFVGVSLFESKNTGRKENNIDVNEIAEKQNQKIEKSTTEKFKELFTNEFFDSQYDTKNIKKIDSGKAIVYGVSETINNEDEYSIDVHLPVININTDITNGYNNSTIQNFAEKVNTLKNGEASGKYTIYDTNFTSYINNDILSVAIMASLKEGENAQRVIVRTYNYDLKEGKEVSLTELLEQKQIDTTTANKKINSEIKKIADEAESVSKSGYDVFKRNIEDEMYDVKNVNNFILGPNGELFVIFAYGDKNNTAEMDVIEIKNK